MLSYQEMVSYMKQSDKNIKSISEQLNPNKVLQLLKNDHPNALNEIKQNQVIILIFPTTYSLLRKINNGTNNNDKSDCLFKDFNEIYGESKNVFKSLELCKNDINKIAIIVSTRLQLSLIGYDHDTTITHTCTIINRP